MLHRCLSLIAFLAFIACLSLGPVLALPQDTSYTADVSTKNYSKFNGGASNGYTDDQYKSLTNSSDGQLSGMQPGNQPVDQDQAAEAPQRQEEPSGEGTVGQDDPFEYSGDGAASGTVPAVRKAIPTEINPSETNAAHQVEDGVPDGQDKHNLTGAQMAVNISNALRAAMKANADPRAQIQKAQTNKMGNAGASGGSKGEAGDENVTELVPLMQEYLINVANEGAGAPTFSDAPIKSYSNAIWMVQQMFKHCYMQIAVLLILPGALLTNMKYLIGFSLLNARDEDTQTPFTGIMRAIIAIFLIPSTQLAVSYIIDTANALESVVSKEVKPMLILLWVYQQIQTFGPEQQGNQIENLPLMKNSPMRGKWAGMPIIGARMEQMSSIDISMTELFNTIFHLMTEGLSIISAFQVVFMCYLFLLGPIAAAFFAWPAGVGRDLFRKCFSTWLDGVVILALWKFWWNIVLLCLSIRLEQFGLVDMFSQVEIYYLMAFISMLLFVPFNPFEFKPGEVVSHILEKANQQAAKVAQGKGGKSGGGSGGGE